MTLRQDIIPGMVYFIPLQVLRNTPSVAFHDLPEELVKGIAAIDRVEHQPGAYSPQAKGSNVERPWYMHPDQEDNLLVLNGRRLVQLYTKDHGKIEEFEVTPTSLKLGDKVIFEGPCLLGWGTHVFHRVHSPNGSVSMNFARHFENFSLDSNFNIYDLNESSGEYKVLREGHLDQPVQEMGE